MRHGLPPRQGGVGAGAPFGFNPLGTPSNQVRVSAVALLPGQLPCRFALASGGRRRTFLISLFYVFLLK